MSKGRDLQDGRPPHGPLTGMAVDVDVAADGSLKRSRTLGGSFCFGGRAEGFSRGTAQTNIPDGTSDTETVRADSEKSVRQDTRSEAGGPTPRLGAFTPTVLRLAMTRCLSLRWPPCPSLDRHREQNAVCLAHPDQSVGPESRDGSESTDRSGDTVSGDNSKEEVRRRASNSLRASRHGVACWSSTSRLPRVRRASGLMAEKDMWLEVELVDVGDEVGDPCYWAEWRLSEKNQELAHGLWLPSHPFED
ncbi:unnamed protein product [Lota lota]